MYKEFEAFKEAAANISARSSSLRSDLETKQAEHAQAAAQYRQMMVDDSAGTKSYTTTELNKAKMRADELASEVEVAKERIEMISDGKSDKLVGLVDDVKKGWRRETDALSTEILQVFREARELRAKLVLKALEAYAKYTEAVKLRNTVNEAQRLAGIKEYSTNLGVPEYVPTGWEDGIVPSADEVTRAYRFGEIPAWLQHYAETGELLTHEEWRQMKTEEFEAAEKEAANPGLLQVAAKGAKGLIDKVLGNDR